MNNNSEIIIYKTEEGKTKLDVKIYDETVWLTQDQMSQLFDKGIPTISEHITNIFKEKELKKKDVFRKFRKAYSFGNEQLVGHYNLDVIISVGYRVKSKNGTLFRIWATQRLREYIIKGFTLDDERLKNGNNRYFDELLERIRDIRSSERNLYQKVTDIYATSIDYKADDKLTKNFFATVQNKMHYAVHGSTAAEVINSRADSSKHNMGLTSFKGSYLTREDIKIAKNYLTEDELKKMNLIVNGFLELAEIYAMDRKPMYMIDWVNKLDDFLKLGEKEVLDNLGSVSSKTAYKKAQEELEKYKSIKDKEYISDFDKEVIKLVTKTKNPL